MGDGNRPDAAIALACPGHVEPAPDLRDFVERPQGRYFIGPTWLEFFTLEGIAGHVLWGRPSEDDAGEFLRVIPPPASPLAQRRARYFDIRRIEPDVTAFGAFAGRIREYAPLLGNLVSEVAIVHNGGLVEAMAKGFPLVATAPFRLEFFVDPAAARLWLGFGQRPLLVRELDELQARAIGTTPVLRDLRAELGASIQHATLRTVAAALGLSARSLQRRLTDENVSFQEELACARVERAQRLLLETDATIQEVCRQVGCASTHHFTVLFQKTTGLTPSRWRAHRRGTAT